MFQCDGNTGHAQPRAGARFPRYTQLRTPLRVCIAIRDANAAQAAALNANRNCKHWRQQWRYPFATTGLRECRVITASRTTRHAAFDASHPLFCP